MESKVSTGEERKLPLILLAVSAVVGAALSAFLSFEHYALKKGKAELLYECSIGESFDCRPALESSFSSFLGMPISNIGLAFYLLVLLLSCFALNSAGQTEKKRSYLEVVAFLSLLSLLPTLGLFLVSVFALDKICPFCLLLYLANLSLCYCSLRALGVSNFRKKLRALGRNVFENTRTALSSDKKGGSRFSLAKLLLFSCILLASLFLPEKAFDFVFQEKKHAIKKEELFLQAWKDSPTRDLEVDSGSSFLETDYYYGSKDAEIEVVAFSDFECPHCRKAASEIKKLVDESNGTVKLVFKNFPLDRSCNKHLGKELHRHACFAASLARCVGAYGDSFFWKMHDAIFSLDVLNRPALENLLQELDLPYGSVKNCIENNISAEKIAKDIEMAVRLGLQGTPAVFVAGKQLQVYRIDTLRAAIAQLQPKTD